MWHGRSNSQVGGGGVTERAVLCTDGCYYWIDWEPIADEPPEPVASDDEIDAWVRDEWEEKDYGW